MLHPLNLVETLGRIYLKLIKMKHIKCKISKAQKAKLVYSQSYNL